MERSSLESDLLRIKPWEIVKAPWSPIRFFVRIKLWVLVFSKKILNLVSFPSRSKPISCSLSDFKEFAPLEKRLKRSSEFFVWILVFSIIMLKPLFYASGLAPINGGFLGLVTFLAAIADIDLTSSPIVIITFDFKLALFSIIWITSRFFELLNASKIYENLNDFILQFHMPIVFIILLTFFWSLFWKDDWASELSIWQNSLNFWSSAKLVWSKIRLFLSMYEDCTPPTWILICEIYFNYNLFFASAVGSSCTLLSLF